MIGSTTLILDSSVIAKWFFSSGDAGEQASRIKEMFLDHEFTISVPNVIYYEINNLLHTAVKRLRVSEKLAQKAYLGFLELELVSYSSKELLTKTLEKSILLDISSYDAAYIALSDYLQCPFITADEKLVVKAKSDNVLSLKSFLS